MINKLKELRQGVEEEGFTLIELMIVVVIIGILAAIAIPIFLNQQKGAIAAGVKSDVKNTVTNIATVLVKKPTAAVIVGATSAPGVATKGFAGATTTKAATDPEFDIVVSDKGTSITIGGTSTTGSVISADLTKDGAWNGYSVVGSNTAAFGAATTHNYSFISTSGKYAGKGDLA